MAETALAPTAPPEAPAPAVDMGALQEKRTKLSSDPDFRTLGPEDQHEVLMNVDIGYRNATPHERQTIMMGIRQNIIQSMQQDLSGERVVDEDADIPVEKTTPSTPGKSLRQTAGEAMGLGTETAGGMAGALKGAEKGAEIGGRVAGPRGAVVGGIVGGVAGAAVGSAAGTVARQPMDVASGVEETMPTGTDLLKKVGISAAAGAAGEGAGRGLIFAWNKAIFEPLGRYLTTGSIGHTPIPGHVAGVEEQAGKMGVTLRPAELTGEDRAALVEQTIRRSIFGRHYFDMLDVQNEAALRTHLDRLSEQFIRPETLSPLEAGAMLQQAVSGEAVPLFRATERQFYKRVKDMAGADGVTVDTKDLVPQLQRLSASIDKEIHPEAWKLVRKMEGLVQEEVVLQSAPKGSGIPTKTVTQPKALDWMDAQDLRSMLLELGRSKELLKDREQGLANTLAESLGRSMEATAKAGGERVYGLWREAQDFSRRGHDLFNDSIIKRLVTARPEDAVDLLFKKNAITENKLLIESLSYAPGEKETAALTAYRRSAMDKLIETASTDGFLTGHKLYNAVYGKNGIGKDVMEVVFGKEYVSELNKTLEVAKRLNMSASASSAGNPSQTGRSLVNWFEQSMLVNIPADFAKHALKGEFGTAVANAAANIQQAGVYVLSMRETGKLLNSPEGLRILREGLQMNEKGERSWRVTGQLLAHVISDAAQGKRKPSMPVSAPQPGRMMMQQPTGNLP